MLLSVFDMWFWWQWYILSSRCAEVTFSILVWLSSFMCVLIQTSDDLYFITQDLVPLYSTHFHCMCFRDKYIYDTLLHSFLRCSSYCGAECIAVCSQYRYDVCIFFNSISFSLCQRIIFSKCNSIATFLFFQACLLSCRSVIWVWWYTIESLVVVAVPVIEDLVLDIASCSSLISELSTLSPIIHAIATKQKQTKAHNANCTQDFLKSHFIRFLLYPLRQRAKKLFIVG